MNRIDGRPTEFEWKIFPGITALGLLEKIQQLLTDLQCEPELFMSMFNDIVWEAKKETKNNVYITHRQLRNMLANSLAVIGLSWGLDHKKNCTELKLTNEMDQGIGWWKK